METKICRKCKEEKELSEFSKDKSRKDGLYCYCKKCKSGYKTNKETLNLWYQKNKESNKEKRKIYYQANRHYLREVNRKYRDANRELILSQKKSYYKKNKDEISIRNAQYRLLHRERYLQYSKLYRETNRYRLQDAKRIWCNKLVDSYVVQLTANQFGINKQDITPELIQLKRLEIALKRKRKEITKK